MVLEEGNTDYKTRIEKTGLYARCCPDVTLRPKDNPDDLDYSFSNDEMYQPILIADGIIGFNCRVLKDKDDVKKAENDETLFEDEWTSSNMVPYKVELTFMLEDAQGRSYNAEPASIKRIVRIPLHEQSKDGARIPGSEEEKKKSGPARGTNRGTNTKGGSTDRGGSAAGVGGDSGDGAQPPDAGGGGAPPGGGGGLR